MEGLDLLIEAGQLIEYFVLVPLIDFLQMRYGVPSVLELRNGRTLDPNMPQSEQMGS